jgi:nicotinamidase-related amidase
MTSLADRPKSALVIVDVQKGVVAEAHERDTVVANIGEVLRRARAAGAPVVWVQHSDDEHLVRGTEAWEYVDELVRDDTEPLVHKRYADAFEDTDLEERLAEGGIGHLVVAGASTDECIRGTLHGALVRGYDATLVADAHTTEDPSQWGLPLDAVAVIAHTNMYWSQASAPGRRGGTVNTADVAF